MTPSDITDWLRAHPLECWGALSAALNLARHYRLLDKLEQTRAGAAVLDVVRAVGIDPAQALRAASTLAGAKAAALGAGVLLTRQDTLLPPSTGAPPSVPDTPPATPRTGGDL